MNAVDHLKAARELIARPGGWMRRGWSASRPDVWRDVEKGSRCYCAEGALLACRDKPNEDVRKGPAAQFLVKAIEEPIVNWNDAFDRTQAEVIAAFDRAIALAEAEAADA